MLVKKKERKMKKENQLFIILTEKIKRKKNIQINTKNEKRTKNIRKNIKKSKKDKQHQNNDIKKQAKNFLIINQKAEIKIILNKIKKKESKNRVYT